MRRAIVFGICWITVLGSAAPLAAQGVDLTVFVGRAYPVHDERLALRPPPPFLPVDITVVGDPQIAVDGGLVFGGAIAFELGVLGIEGRLDATDVGFNVRGARYDLYATAPPFEGLTGSLTIGNGRLDANRLYLLSGNLRLRTPGPVGLVVSGGVSLLPEVVITGSAPLALEIGGVSPIPGVEPRLRLRAAPGESEHRIGVNGGAGLRIGGGPLAVQAEVRAFYFREYELTFDAAGSPDLVQSLLEGIAPVRFEPVIVNAQVGLVFRF